jgi:hypothetical protein
MGNMGVYYLNEKAVPWLSRSVARLVSRRPGFNLGQVHVIRVVHKVTPAQVSLQVFLVRIIPPVPDIHLTYSILLMTKRVKPGGLPTNATLLIKSRSMKRVKYFHGFFFQVSEKFLSFKCSQFPLFCSFIIKSFPSYKLIKPNSRIFIKSL